MCLKNVIYELLIHSDFGRLLLLLLLLFLPPLHLSGPPSQLLHRLCALITAPAD